MGSKLFNRKDYPPSEAVRPKKVKQYFRGYLLYR